MINFTEGFEKEAMIAPRPFITAKGVPLPAPKAKPVTTVTRSLLKRNPLLVAALAAPPAGLGAAYAYKRYGGRRKKRR